MCGIHKVAAVAAHQPVFLHHLFQRPHGGPELKILHFPVVQVHDVHVILLGLDIEHGLRRNHQFEALGFVIEADEGFLVHGGGHLGLVPQHVQLHGHRQDGKRENQDARHVQDTEGHHGEIGSVGPAYSHRDRQE